MEALTAPNSQSGEVEHRIVWVMGSDVVLRLRLNKKGKPVFIPQGDLVEVLGGLGAAVDVGEPVVGALLCVIFDLFDSALAAGGKEVEDILHSFAGEHFDVISKTVGYYVRSPILRGTSRYQLN